MSVNVTEKVHSKSEVKTNRIPSKIKGGKLYSFNKRMFDFFSSFVIIILFSWLLLILFILQLFATKGHPIFVDKRVGRKGKIMDQSV